MINEFRGKYFFLSNFYEAPVVYKGTYRNNEAAFQAGKCPSRAKEFENLNPSEAKKLGGKVELRPDWESIKYRHMFMVCYMKFAQNEDLKRRLLDTGDEHLEEGNTWGDREWGTVNGVGNNELGKILMDIRSDFKTNY